MSSKTEWIGKNTDFTALWNFHRQAYYVYHKGVFLTKAYKFSDIASYLD